MRRPWSAQGLTEYALILTLVALVVIGVLFFFGTTIANFLTNTGSTVADPSSSVP